METTHKAEFVRHTVNTAIINQPKICTATLECMDILIYTAKNELIDRVYNYLKSKNERTINDAIIVKNTLKKYF